MKPIDDVSDLLQIAFGYMASKALFTAVSIGVFDVLDSSSKSLAETQKTIGGEPEAVKTLIAALTAIGLIARKDEMFSNSPVAQLPLTKSGGSQFSKYLNMQVDQLMYPMLQHLTDALKGNRDQVPYYDYEIGLEIQMKLTPIVRRNMLFPKVLPMRFCKLHPSPSRSSGRYGKTATMSGIYYSMMRDMDSGRNRTG